MQLHRASKVNVDLRQKTGTAKICKSEALIHRRVSQKVTSALSQLWRYHSFALTASPAVFLTASSSAPVALSGHITLSVLPTKCFEAARDRFCAVKRLLLTLCICFQALLVLRRRAYDAGTGRALRTLQGCWTCIYKNKLRVLHSSPHARPKQGLFFNCF